MKPLVLCIALLCLSLAASGQKTSDAIQSQIKSLKAEKQIELTYDGGTSKIFAKSDNFSDADAKAAKVDAVNFGMAIFFPGNTLTASPDTVNLTFWVLSKKPRFAGGSKWIVTLPSETLDLGDSRYTSKPANQLEYLNFKIARTDLAKIAAGSNVKFKLGEASFTFTSSQIQLFKNILAVSDPK